ncbi:MAG: hypothetical protein EXR99_10320 [Gemmataceae bacterium]|nr:hypothetical protein [Gemmataceae bacterium]
MALVLPLFQIALRSCRQYWKLGRHEELQALLKRLSQFAKLPKKVAENIQFLFGRLSFCQGKYHRAGRHFAICLAHDPGNADYHYWLGRALARHGSGDLNAAKGYFQKCLKINPCHSRALAFLGITLCKQGAEIGLDYLREAVAIKPRSLGILRRLVRMLQQNGKFSEAVAITTRALFRNRANSEFLVLRNTTRFHEARREQEVTTSQTSQPAIILPFLKLKSVFTEDRFRTDEPQLLPTPHALKARRERRQSRFR